MQPLTELTVLSLEQATVLPYLTYRLAQDGAQVIRLEHPIHGDPNRLVGEPLPGQERMNRYFLCINAGKKAITLNLAEARGQVLLARLLVELNVDVFATNQLPSSYRKLGISYEQLKQVKPDLIWLGVSGFGPDHPEPAYDPILQARGGLMELTGPSGGEPQVLGIPLPDMGASEHAYGLLMKALYQRQRSGQGAALNVSMFASTLSWLTVPITLTGSFGETITRRGNTHQFFAPVSVYPTSDGFVYLAVGNDRQFQALVDLPEFSSLDRPEYVKNLGRIHDVENLNRQIVAITQGMTSDELLGKLLAIRLPASKIQTIAEVLEDPLVKPSLLTSRDPVTGTDLVLAPPPHPTAYLEDRGQTLDFPPRFGQHNAEVLGRLGLGPDELDSLAQAGVI
ncbi:MAG: CoA transferase [Desulfarculus sp.]|nr:CoA transferase [Desulfarculus sp.]